MGGLALDSRVLLGLAIVARLGFCAFESQLLNGRRCGDFTY